MRKIISKIFILAFAGLMSLMLVACMGNAHLGVWDRIENGVRTGLSKELTDDGMWAHPHFGIGGFRVSGNTVRFYTLMDVQVPTVFRIGTITGDMMHVENILSTGSATYIRAGANFEDTFTITFNTGGGTNVAPITAPASTLVQAPTPPTRPGFIFDGWADINGNRRTFPHLLTANITLHAIWIDDTAGDFITSCGLFFDIINNEIWITGLHTTNMSITVPSFVNGLPVRRINDEAFAYTNIASIVIPSTVTSIGHAAFLDAWNLTTVTLNNGLITIESFAFAWTNIAIINIPSSVRHIEESAFLSTSNLGTVTLNEGLLTIGDRAFAWTGLTEIIIPSTVTSIGLEAFDSWVNVIEWSEDASKLLFDIVNNNEIWITGFDSAHTLSTTLNIPSYINNLPVTRIDNFAFLWSNIRTLVIPSTVTSIGTEAFGGSWNLTSVTLNEGLKTIEFGAFMSSAITEIVIPSTVTYIGDWAFADNWNLSSLTLNEGLVTIGHGAFCAIDISELIIPATVTNIGHYAFSLNPSLTTVTLNEGLLIIGDEAFRHTNISEIIIPSTVTHLGFMTFDENVNIIWEHGINPGLIYSVWVNEVWISGFDGFSATSSVVVIPSYINGLPVTRIESFAFLWSEITMVVIPSTVWFIGESAFESSWSLTNVFLSEGLHSIAARAFRSTSLSYIILPPSVTIVATSAFDWWVEQIWLA